MYVRVGLSARESIITGFIGVDLLRRSRARSLPGAAACPRRPPSTCQNQASVNLHETTARPPHTEPVAGPPPPRRRPHKRELSWGRGYAAQGGVGAGGGSKSRVGPGWSESFVCVCVCVCVFFKKTMFFPLCPLSFLFLVFFFFFSFFLLSLFFSLFFYHLSNFSLIFLLFPPSLSVLVCFSFVRFFYPLGTLLFNFSLIFTCSICSAAFSFLSFGMSKAPPLSAEPFEAPLL